MKVDIGDFPDDSSGREVHVEISTHDIWNLDHTLAVVIHPALVKIKEAKPGAPFVDEEDVPEHLKMTPEEYKDFQEGGDSSEWFKKYDYVLDEMIWTFDQLANHDEPLEGFDVWDDRVSNGLRLFAKYYRSLWI